MSNVARISEINETLDSFKYNYLGLTLGSILAVLIIVLVILIYKSEKGPDRMAWVLIVFFGISIPLLIERNADERELVRERTELEFLERFDEVSKITIETKQIISSTPTREKYCPHVELKDSETCTFVSFASEESVTQLFIPLAKSISADSESPLKITYLELSNKDREKIINYNKFIHSHEVFKEGWSLGVIEPN